MVVSFVRQSHLLSVQTFIQLRLQKARILFDFPFVVNRVDFRSFFKTEMELNKNLGVTPSFEGFRKLIKLNKTIIPFALVGYQNGY